MNDLRCLGKVHAPANYRKLEFEIPQLDLSRCQSFIYDVRMNLGRFCVLFSCIGNRVFIIFECCFTLTKHKNGGGGGVHNSGHRLALGHVNDLRCLGKLHAPANNKKLEFEIPQVYLSRCQSFIYDVRMHLGRFCVLFGCKSLAIHVSS